MKKKWSFLTAVAVVTASLLTGCGGTKETEGTDKAESAEDTAKDLPKPEGELNLYTWAGMFPQEVLDGFEERYGVKINYTNFDYNEDMLAKLEETEGGEYDFIIADDYILELIQKEGLCRELDKEQLPNYGNINPVFQGQFYDPEDTFSVPYGAGIPLIVYDPALTDVEIKGYSDLWNPSLADNVALIGNYRVINGITLKTMGESFNTEDLSVIEKAGEKLETLADNVRVISDSNTQDFLVSGEVAAAFLYSSQVSAALNAREDLVAVYPEEGLGFGIMAGFIPSNAPNAEAAHAFINYLLEPEISAQCIEYIGYYCTNKEAEQYISEEMKPFVVLPEDAAKGEIIQNVSAEAEALHSEIWNQFRTACD